MVAKAAPKKPTAKKPAAKRKPAARAATKKAPERKPALVAKGLALVSVFGPFGSRALVEMSAERAGALFDAPLSSALAPTRVVDATLARIADLAKRSKGIDGTPIAAAAVALAYEIDSPFNSATSKSLCTKELRELMKQLDEQAPEKTSDALDELQRQRDKRLAAPKRAPRTRKAASK